MHVFIYLYVCIFICICHIGMQSCEIPLDYTIAAGSTALPLFSFFYYSDLPTIMEEPESGNLYVDMFTSSK
jgi:hypothetical protein